MGIRSRIEEAKGDPVVLTFPLGILLQSWNLLRCKPKIRECFFRAVSTVPG